MFDEKNDSLPFSPQESSSHQKLDINNDTISQSILQLSYQNSELRNKCTKNENSLEAITTAVDSNTIITSEMIYELENENELLKSMIEDRCLLLDEIEKANEVKSKLLLNSDNYDDFLFKCQKLQTRLDHARKIYNGDSDQEGFDIFDLKLKLAYLKQKNIIEQTKLSGQIDSLLKKKKEILFKLEKLNSNH